MFLECDCLKYLGLCFCAYLALRVLCPLWSLVNIYFLGSYPNFKKYGSWSVVTGATDGIGLAFAKKLAKFGQNIVLISRSKDRPNDAVYLQTLLDIINLAGNIGLKFL